MKKQAVDKNEFYEALKDLTPAEKVKLSKEMIDAVFAGMKFLKSQQKTDLLSVVAYGVWKELALGTITLEPFPVAKVFLPKRKHGNN